MFNTVAAKQFSLAPFNKYIQTHAYALCVKEKTTILTENIEISKVGKIKCPNTKPIKNLLKSQRVLLDIHKKIYNYINICTY